MALIGVARCAELRIAIEASGLHAECLGDPSALSAHPFALVIAEHRFDTLLPLIVFGEGSDCIRALESGADDCVPRSISPRELVARIHSVLRRTPAPQPALDISLSEMRVRTGTATHNLTRGEAEVLSLLLDHAPSPVPTRRIAELLAARRGTIESRIKGLRRKLGPERLVSRGSLGYQLVDRSE